MWQLLLDFVIAAVVAADVYQQAQQGFAEPIGLVLLLGGALAAASRRRAPAGALACSAAFTLLLPLVGDHHLPAWCLIQVCLMSFAMTRERGPAVTATSIVGLILVGESLTGLGTPVFDPLTLALVAWTAAAGGIGNAVHSQRQYVAALEEQSRNLLATREAVVARRIAQERMRIARELHDVMAHHIAAINVHAGSAQANITSDVDTSQESLSSIRAASGEVLKELQAILHVLRSEESETDCSTVPVPGISQLSRLLDSVSALGVRLYYQEEAVSLLPRDLPPAVDLALYRIAQEALTNAHKHGTGRAWFHLGMTKTAIILKICNDTENRHATPAADTPGSSHGFGIIGMQERAISAGGNLNVTTKPGKFVLEATFPLRQAS